MAPDEPEDQEVDESLFPNDEDFKEAQGIWGEGQEQADKAKPTGPFQASIENAVLERSSSGERLQIHYELKILTPGKFADEVLHKYDGLGSPQQASISQNQLRRLGVDTKKVNLKTLPAHLLNLKGKKCVINCRQKGEYHNIFFTKLLSNTPMGGPRPGAGGATTKPGGGKPAAPVATGAGGKKSRF